MLSHWCLSSRSNNLCGYFVSFKTSPILYSWAEISWFIPFIVHAALCIRTHHSSTGSSMMVGLALWSTTLNPIFLWGQVSIRQRAVDLCTTLGHFFHSCTSGALHHKLVVGRSQQRYWGAALQTGNTVHSHGEAWSKSQLWEPVPDSRDLIDQYDVNVQWGDSLSFFFFFLLSKLYVPWAETNLSLFAHMYDS